MMFGSRSDKVTMRGHWGENSAMHCARFLIRPVRADVEGMNTCSASHWFSYFKECSWVQLHLSEFPCKPTVYFSLDTKTLKEKQMSVVLRNTKRVRFKSLSLQALRKVQRTCHHGAAHIGTTEDNESKEK